MGETPSGTTIVIPAKAGISGREVSAGLPETPAFAGVTGGVSPRDPGLRRDDGLGEPS
jgi:hypothetical protein